MKIITFSLVSSLAVLLISGCDSDCCMDVQPEVANIPPTPIIQLDGQPVGSTLTCDPTENGVITLTAASTDSDGQVIDNIWKVGNTEVQNGVVECPNPGESKQICLIAVDNNNLDNQTCFILIGKSGTPPEEEPSTLPPYIELKKGFKDHNDAGFIGCKEIHDEDNIDSDNKENPYGTDHAIEEIYWDITYADGTPHDPNPITQTLWNGTDPLFNEGDCGKWVQHTGAKIPVTIKVTPIDDEGEKMTYEYIMDQTGNLKFIKSYLPNN